MLSDGELILVAGALLGAGWVASLVDVWRHRQLRCRQVMYLEAGFHDRTQEETRWKTSDLLATLPLSALLR